MISARLQTVALVVCVLYFAAICSCLKKKYFKLRYALVWFLSGFIMLALAIAPELLDKIAAFVGIYSATNALFILLIACIIVILITLTIIVSRQAEKIKRLTQSLALLEKQVREMERQNEAAE